MLVDVTKDGGFLYNNISDNNDRPATIKEILLKYPVLKSAFENGIFKSVPIEGNEKRFYEKIYDAGSSEGLNMEDTILYASFKELSKYEWSIIPVGVREPVIKAAIEANVGDVPLDVLKDYPALERRYWVKKKQGVELEMNEWDYNDDWDFTPDESKILANMDHYPEKFLSIIIEDWSKQFIEMLASSNRLDKMTPHMIETMVDESPYSLPLLYVNFRNANMEIPDNLLDGICYMPSLIVNTASLLINNGYNVPEEMLKSLIVNKSETSRLLTIMIRADLDLPPILLKAVAKGPVIYLHSIVKYMESTGMKVPKILMNALKTRGVPVDETFASYFRRED